jgi:tetratricopeptide (TPR) repeat protein
VYEKTLDANPNSYKLWEKVLNVYYDSQQWSGLIIKSIKSIKTFPLKTLPYYMLSVACNQTKQYSQANKTAQEGIDMIGLVMPGKNRIVEADLWGQLGESNFGVNQYEEAKNNYLTAIKISQRKENDYLKFNFCFRLYEYKKDLDLAIEFLDEMLLTDKTENFEVLLLKGDIYFKKEDFEEALVVFNKLRVDYENPLVYERIGDVKAKLNNLKEALEFWKEAQKLGLTNAILQKKIENEAYFE